MLLVVAALVLAFCGLRLSLSGVAAYQAQSFVDDWEQTGAAPDETAWGVARDAANRAVAFYPGTNGDYLARLGRIYEWRDMGRPFGDPEAQAAREQARDAYRQAIESRPDWPFTWVQLGLIKLRLLEFDEEFDRALQQGFDNGPWRLGVYRGIAEIGLIAWPQLDEAQRRQVLEAARRTVAFSDAQASRLFTLAEHADQDALLCRELPKSLQARRRLCYPPGALPWPAP